MPKGSTVTFVLALVSLIAAVSWIDHHFEEPAATEIRSLVSELAVTSVLAVLAHPDDEIQIAALLADAARQSDTVVRTITVTRGEAGMGPEPISRPEHLGAVRAAELYRFGFVLGVDQQELWSYPDGALTNASGAGLVEDLVARIRLWKPDLVVTFDAETGLTLNPDHMIVSTVTAIAVEAAGDLERFPTLGRPHRSKWLGYILAPRRMLVRFGGTPGQEIADHQPEPDYAIAAHRQLKVQGWEIHSSQKHVIRELFGVPPWILYLFWDKEYYAVEDRGAN